MATVSKINGIDVASIANIDGIALANISKYVGETIETGLADIDNVYSMEFDGSDDYIKASLDGTATGGILAASDSDVELTISFWFYMDGSQSLKGIFQWANEIIDLTPMILVNTAGASIKTWVNGGYQHTSGITMSAWHHYAVTRTASTNIWEGYIDGVSVFTTDDTGTITDRASAIDLYFGAGYNGYLDGNIDEAAIWNSALSALEINEIYNATSTGKTADLSTMSTPPVTWYRMGD